uniref:zinc finger protein 462-like isoform X3 n=1 Tax=Pristiophorus japonicus TaxID=55135 RepID=UPI00398F0F16
MTGSENENTLLIKEDFGLASTEEKSGVLHCPVCLYYTKHKSRLINHILEHKKVKWDSAFSVELLQSPDSLNRMCQHKTKKQKDQETSTNLWAFVVIQVFCCDWCTFITLSQDSLIHHMDTHSPVKPYKYRLCFFEAILLTELETHLQEQHKVKCNFDLVGEVNLNETDLVVEIEEFQRKRLKSHGEKKRIQRCIRCRRSTKAIRFPCEFCGRRFLDPSEWIGHVQRHSIDPRPVSTIGAGRGAEGAAWQHTTPGSSTCWSRRATAVKRDVTKIWVTDWSVGRITAPTSVWWGMISDL